LASESRRKELCEHYLDVFENVRPPDMFPLAQMLFDNVQPILASLKSSPQVRKRLVDSICEQIRALSNPIVYQIDTLSFDRYLALRRIDVFGEWVANLLEYALDVDIGDALKESAALRRMRTAAIDSVTIANDFFSFRKEVPVKDSLNGIWVLMREYDWDIQQAIHRLAGIFRENEQALIDAREQVLATALGGRTDVQRYMTALECFHTGNVEFHRFSTRYQGLDFKGRFTSGEVTIEPMPSLYEIAASSSHLA
jgi:hypothetical protein